MKLWVSLHVKKRQWQLQWHWNCMFHFPNFGIALALFQMLPSNKCHTRGRFKINWNKCKRYLSEEVLYMFAFIFCKYVVCRGVQFCPLYLMPPFWNSADPPVNCHLYTSEDDGPHITDTVSKPTLFNRDSSQGRKQTNLAGNGIEHLDNFWLWHCSFSTCSYH